MKIKITQASSFVIYRGTIGIVLYTPENSLKVNFFTGRDHREVNRKSIGSPSMEKLEDELYVNDELRSLAEENELIEISFQDTTTFLKYS